MKPLLTTVTIATILLSCGGNPEHERLLRELEQDSARLASEAAAAEAVRAKREAERDSIAAAERAAAIAAWEEAKPQVMARLRTDTDKFEGITWYYPKAAPKYSNSKALFLYMGRKGEAAPWLRFRCRYSGDNWIFAKSVTVSIDGQKHELEPGPDGWERDNASGDVWEYFDKSPTSDDVSLMRSIADSKETIIRWSGDQYYSDYTVTKADKQGITDIFAAYKGMGGDVSSLPVQ